MRFSESLQKSALLLDGSIGMELGRFPRVGSSECMELLNITRPMDVLDIHSLYIDAGADVITANTFGASSLRLDRLGLEHQSEEIVESGIALSKEAASEAGRKVYVAASIGPTGEDWRSDIHMPMKMYLSFCGQCTAAAQAGADMILIEMMSDLFEARMALLAARASCKLPVLCGFKLEPGGKTLAGNPPEVLSLVSKRLGASMCGVTCGLSPDELFPGYSELAGASSIPTFASPSAKDINGETLVPDEMAASMLPYLNNGVCMIGGCCNMTPAHTASMRRLLDQYHGNARKAEAHAEYVCSGTHRVALSSIEGGKPVELSGLSYEDGEALVHSIEKNSGVVHIDFANWCADDVRGLIYCTLLKRPGIALAFHVYTAEQAEAALFVYPGIAPIYAHSDAYRVLKLAVRYGAEVIS